MIFFKRKNRLKYKISKTSLKLAKIIPIEYCKLKTLPLSELKIENKLKRKVSSNIDDIIHDDLSFVNNNNSPLKIPKLGS